MAKKRHRQCTEESVLLDGVEFFPHALARCRRRGLSLELVAIAVAHGKRDREWKCRENRTVYYCSKRVLKRFAPRGLDFNSGIRVVLAPTGEVVTSFRMHRKNSR